MFFWINIDYRFEIQKNDLNHFDLVFVSYPSLFVVKKQQKKMSLITKIAIEMLTSKEIKDARLQQKSEAPEQRYAL